MSRGSTVPRLGVGEGRDEREVRRPGGTTWCGRAGSGHSARAVAQAKGVGRARMTMESGTCGCGAGVVRGVLWVRRSMRVGRRGTPGSAGDVVRALLA